MASISGYPFIAISFDQRRKYGVWAMAKIDQIVFSKVLMPIYAIVCNLASKDVYKNKKHKKKTRIGPT